MSVVNLQPGNVMNVGAGQIRQTAHVYRTGQGYPDPGHVGWLPNGGALNQVPLAVGGTINFPINGTSGMIANGCPSMVQVLWDNATAAITPNVIPTGATKILKRALASSSAASDGSVQQAMQTLNAQWYNALTSGLNLDPSTFQLMQGNSVVGTLTETLWSIFDAIPPLSVNNLFNPSQFNSFSSNYGSIVNNLNQPGSNQFQNDMGDYYPAWSSFLSQQASLPTGGIMSLFQSWSQLHMPAGLAMQCYSDLSALYQGSVYNAITMWIAAGGSSGTTDKAYNITVEQVTTKIAQAPSGSVTMDSSTETSDVSHTWAKGEVGGWYDLFAGEAGTEYDALSMDLIKAGLNISVQFSHVLTIPGAPLMQPSMDPILSKYTPWYLPAALQLAYQNNNNIVWKNNPPTWDNMFNASTGAMLRVCSALIIVDGITVTTKSSASFSISDQTQFQAEAAVGFWPFFEANASGGWNNNFSFDDEGKFTYSASSPVGNPVILGVIVTPIEGAMML